MDDETTALVDELLEHMGDIGDTRWQSRIRAIKAQHLNHVDKLQQIIFRLGDDCRNAQWQLNALRETLPGGHVAYEQAVDLALYVSEHAKGGMKARVDEFLSTEYAQVVLARQQAAGVYS